MRYAIVGNREGFTYKYVKSVLDELGVYKSDIIVSGGAAGVDSFAERYAKLKGCEMKIFYPDPSKPSPDRYFERNKKIVLNADIVIAFNKKETSGTTNTIGYARKFGKAVKVFAGSTSDCLSGGEGSNPSDRIFEAAYCKKCIQITNHNKDGKCLKCKIKMEQKNATKDVPRD